MPYRAKIFLYYEKTKLILCSGSIMGQVSSASGLVLMEELGYDWDVVL